MKNPKVDVIIPAYNAHKTINKTLLSIMEQSYLPNLEVTIVNDGGEPYDIEKFSQFMKIREIGYVTNKGPGFARQYGINHTSNPFFVFIDADDLFGNVFTIANLVKKITESDDIIRVGGMVLQQRSDADIAIVDPDKAYVFCHGKIYRRSFIDEFCIRFPETYANEDMAFNEIIVALTEGFPQFRSESIEDCCYCWMNNSSSVTRKNNGEFADVTGIGYIQNMGIVIQFLSSIDGMSELIIKKLAYRVVCDMYIEYLRLRSNGADKSVRNQLGGAATEYFQKYIGQIDMDLMTFVYHDCMQNAYAVGYMSGIIPSMSFSTWLERLGEEA